MIERIVRLTFDPEKQNDFLQLFLESSDAIKAMDGCMELRLLRDIRYPNQFTTHSVWESEASLEAYRNSELFRSTWAKTKVMFAARPEAWSYRQVSEKD